MEKQSTIAKDFALENIISTAVKIPGVKVDRKKFLAETFATENVILEDILEFGPIQANVSQENLSKIANKLILKRTTESSIASFVAGIPGGLAMAATIPADVLQFFGMSLRLAQEIAYLYGADDLWKNGEVDDDKIKNQLILYCGVMFGVSGAVSGVRVLSAQIAKTTLKKLPQKALTKTFWYPIIKQIGKAIGVKITKSTVAKGISKAVPIVGGVISGGLNFASMHPMAKRLQVTFDKSCFDYTEAELNADIAELESININDESIIEEPNNVYNNKEKVSNGIKKVGTGVFGLFAKKNDAEASNEDVFQKIEKLSKLKKMGAITQEEFDAKKAELLERI